MSGFLAQTKIQTRFGTGTVKHVDNVASDLLQKMSFSCSFSWRKPGGTRVKMEVRMPTLRHRRRLRGKSTCLWERFQPTSHH